jgi:hypothetical protein
MSLYAMYASPRVLVGVRYDYLYDAVIVCLGRRARGHPPASPPPDVCLDRLLQVLAPQVVWDAEFEGSAKGAAEAKLAEAALLLQTHCSAQLRGQNLEILDQLRPSAQQLRAVDP